MRVNQLVCSLLPLSLKLACCKRYNGTIKKKILTDIILLCRVLQWWMFCNCRFWNFSDSWSNGIVHFICSIDHLSFVNQFRLFGVQSIITMINHAIGADGIVSKECKAVVENYGQRMIDLLVMEVN